MEDWLETEGSPFIIIEEINLKEWDAINNYEKICAVKNYIEKMNIKNKDILVFGDEPFPLKLIKNGNEIIIIRWVYAPDKSIVDKIITLLDYKILPIIDTVSIKWNTDKLILFDGIKNDNETKKEYIKIHTKNKNWNINTMEYKTGDIFLIIHKIEME
jgi:hypothetical protein